MTQDWNRDTQKRGVLLWISFLTAAAMSVLFFGFVDPLLVIDAVGLEYAESREVGYTVVFFFFWLGSATSSWLCLRLTRRKRNWPKPIGAMSTTAKDASSHD